MEPRFEPVSYGNAPTATPGQGAAVALDQNRVLRNTYWLLALSMLPTVAGAFVGMQLNFYSLFVAHPIATPLLMFGAMLGSLFVVTRLRNSAWAVPAMFGFTFVSGVFLAPILTVAAGMRNGGELVALAGGMTAVILFVMAGIATVTKRDFSFLSKFLFVGLILLIVASLANLFFAVPAASLAISTIAVMIFSLYILHDVSRIIHGGETNYVMAALSLFLDVYNIFVNLLYLLMALTGQRD